MSLSAAINQRLHAGSTCPGAGSLGECPAIWLGTPTSTLWHYYAAVYLWPPAADSLPFAEVARWFKEETGAETILINHIVHDEWNYTAEGLCEDGARALTVEFALTPERAIELGMEEPKTTPPEAEPSTRMGVSELLGVRAVTPHITAERCKEVAEMQVNQLQLRLITSFDWHWRYQHALDGIPQILNLPGSGVDGCRMHEETRAVVTGLLARLDRQEQALRDIATANFPSLDLPGTQTVIGLKRIAQRALSA